MSATGGTAENKQSGFLHFAHFDEHGSLARAATATLNIIGHHTGLVAVGTSAQRGMTLTSSEAPGCDLTLRTPIDVVAEAVRLLLGEDYFAAADLYHSDFVRGRVEEAWEAARPRAYRPAVEDLLRQDPEMPRDVAEYEARRAANAPPPPPSFSEVYGVQSEPELDALEPKEVLARQLWAADPRWRFRAYLDELAGTHPKYRDQLTEQKARLTHLWHTVPLGWVAHGDHAYVVLGSTLESLHGRKKTAPDDGVAELVVLRREEKQWRISSSLGLRTGAIVAHLHVAVKDEDGETVVLS